MQEADGLLAQLPHDAPRLDLGDKRWVLHTFMCPGRGDGSSYTFCDFWDSGSGANVVFVVDRAALGRGLVSHPDQPTQHGEVFITGWTEREDRVPLSEAEAYRDYDRWSSLPEKVQVPDGFNWIVRTKFGGTPYWTGNGPMSYPPSPYQFAYQIDDLLHIDGPIPDADTAGCPVYNKAKGSQKSAEPARRKPNAPPMIQQNTRKPYGYYFEIANFCSDGTAFVYLDRTADPPHGVMFINR